MVTVYNKLSDDDTVIIIIFLVNLSLIASLVSQLYYIKLYANGE